MKFPGLKKKPSYTHKRMLLSEPNSLIGYRIGDGDIQLMSVLGVGGHGVVFRALDSKRSPPHAYAVKALSKVGLDARQLRAIHSEFALHERVSGHDHVVTFHGIIEEPDFFFVLLDFIPNGDVFDMIDIRAAYLGNDQLIKAVFVQLVDAVAHCHRLGVAHRDIKPENILCKDDGKHWLLADFGLATDRMVVREYGFGSEPYMAPQCFGGFWKNLGPYSTSQTDIWSLGVVLVNLVCASNPWHKATAASRPYRAFLDNPDHLLISLPISRELNTILRGTFSVNPHGRPTLDALRESVLAVSCFTRVPAVPRSIELTPGAVHTEVARQITNLTIKDITRLESEAREDARAAELRAEIESACENDGDEDDDEDERPLFMSPTPTLVAQDTTPRPHHIASFRPQPVVSVPELDSDSDSEGSEGPITPTTQAALDVEVANVPELSLDDDEGASKSEMVEKDVVEVTRSCTMLGL